MLPCPHRRLVDMLAAMLKLAMADEKAKAMSIQSRFIFPGWRLSNPLPAGAGGTPLAGSGRRPGEGRPEPARLALIRRFAAPSPSGRRKKHPLAGE
jgi:hypothetical protein